MLFFQPIGHDCGVARDITELASASVATIDTEPVARPDPPSARAAHPEPLRRIRGSSPDRFHPSIQTSIQTSSQRQSRWRCHFAGGYLSSSFGCGPSAALDRNWGSLQPLMGSSDRSCRPPAAPRNSDKAHGASRTRWLRLMPTGRKPRRRSGAHQCEPSPSDVEERITLLKQDHRRGWDAAVGPAALQLIDAPVPDPAFSDLAEAVRPAEGGGRRKIFTPSVVDDRSRVLRRWPDLGASSAGSIASRPHPSFTTSAGSSGVSTPGMCARFMVTFRAVLGQL